jgi:hypothetical protein
MSSPPIAGPRVVDPGPSDRVRKLQGTPSRLLAFASGGPAFTEALGSGLEPIGIADVCEHAETVWKERSTARPTNPSRSENDTAESIGDGADPTTASRDWPIPPVQAGLVTWPAKRTSPLLRWRMR